MRDSRMISCAHTHQLIANSLVVDWESIPRVNFGPSMVYQYYLLYLFISVVSPYTDYYVLVVCTVYSVHCTLYTAYNIQHTIYTVQYTAYTVHCTQRTIYTVHCTLYNIHCTSYYFYGSSCNVHCAMKATHCTINPRVQEMKIS